MPRLRPVSSVQIVNHQQNLPAFEKKISYQANRRGVAERFEGDSVRKMVSLDIDLIDFYDRQIQDLDLYLEQKCQDRRATTDPKFRTAPLRRFGASVCSSTSANRRRYHQASQRYRLEFGINLDRVLSMIQYSLFANYK